MDSSVDSDFECEDKYFYRKIVAYRRILFTVQIDKIDDYLLETEDVDEINRDELGYDVYFRNGFKTKLIVNPFFLKRDENACLMLESEYKYDYPPDSVDKKYDEEYEDEHSRNKYYDEEKDWEHVHQYMKAKCFIVKNDEKHGLKILCSHDNYDDNRSLFKISADEKSKFSDKNQLSFVFEIKLIFNFEKIKFKTPFAKFFDEDSFNDFKIICCDGVEIAANKIVLSLFSPVFETMFKNNLMEMKSGEMKLDDLDGETMKEFVKFLYLGTVENLKEIVISLIYAAEKYQVMKLKQTCVAFMKDNLSVENVFETFNVAELCSVKGLRAQCIEFMKFEYDLLKDSLDFKKLNPDLMNEIVVEKDVVNSSIEYPMEKTESDDETMNNETD